MKKQLRQKHTNTCSHRGSRVTECPEGIPMWEEHGRAMQQNDVCSQPSICFLKWAAQNLRLQNTGGDARNNTCLQSQTDTHSQLCCGNEKSQVYVPDNLFCVTLLLKMIIIRPKPNPRGTRVYLLSKLIQLHSLNRWRCVTDVLWVQVWHHEKVGDGSGYYKEEKQIWSDIISGEFLDKCLPLWCTGICITSHTHTHTHMVYQQDPQSYSSQAMLRLIPHYCSLLQVSISRQHGFSFRKNNKPLRFFCLSFCFTHSSWAIHQFWRHASTAFYCTMWLVEIRRRTQTAPRQRQGSHAAAVQLAALLVRQHTKGAAQDWKTMRSRGQCHTILQRREISRKKKKRKKRKAKNGAFTRGVE